MAGTERWVITGSRLEPVNAGGSVFIGERAGINDDLTNNQNVAVGWEALNTNTTGTGNTAIGGQALHANTTGSSNIANGLGALVQNTTGSSNIAIGRLALSQNGTGSDNTAIGSETLFQNTTGNDNTAIGRQALWSNTTASSNTATGQRALMFNTTGYDNTAVGTYALSANTTAYANTAVGNNALYSNTTGSQNTAVGSTALYSNTTGGGNTAMGREALYFNTTGIWNTAVGYDALLLNNTGSNSVAIGLSALSSNTTGFQNTALGATANDVTTTGSYNTSVGYNTGPNGGALFNTTCVGIDATAAGSNMVRIGNTFVTSIGGYQNWTNISDGRFKRNVNENVPGLAFITKLHPVTYTLDFDAINEAAGVKEMERYSSEERGNAYAMKHSGLIAQDVERAAQSLGYDFSGVDVPRNENDLYGLRYAEFVVPLVKAIQELNDENNSLRKELECMKLQTQQTLSLLQGEIEHLKQYASVNPAYR